MISPQTHLPPRLNLFATLRRDYFGSLASGLTSVSCLALMIWLGWLIVDWAILSAIWSVGEDTGICSTQFGACWAVIAERGRLIFFGLYPYEAQWRSALAVVIMIAVSVSSCLPYFWTAKRLSLLWLFGFVAFFVLMRGGVLGLSEIPERSWGGLALTLFIFTSVMVIGMPLAIGLALLRRSSYPAIAWTTGMIIDGVRSVPLISILFAFAILLPLMLPGWLDSDKLYRVIVGYALFFAAYQAEILRGGMQIIPNGQTEAAQALGLSYFQTISLVVLPQAFKNALPPTINQVVVTFKETSLVIIVGFFEVLASGNAAYGTGRWSFAYVEVYVFIGLIYFSFVFSLSRYGAYLEQRLDVGHR